jgi:gas vesicle protein
MRRHYNDNGYLMGSILGGALAATVTYFLYGTEKGERTRKEIRRTANRAKDKAVEMKDSALATSGELMDITKETYGNLTELISSKKAALKNIERDDVEWVVERFRDRMQDVWDETQDDIEEVIDDAEE